MRFHAVGQHKLRFADVSGVQAKVLLDRFDMSEIQRNNAIPKKLGKGRAIVPIGSGYDERQRDAIRVDQQIPFAAVFFPYR